MSDTIKQGSELWFAQRLGKATASRIADIVAKTKTGYGASREGYKTELALEIITGARQESYTNGAMQWGTDTEPRAREAYEAHTGEIVIEVGMIDHPTIDRSGASPDGLVEPSGQIEIKCPNSATHMATLLSKKPAARYNTQMQWQMACTGREWCDFVSFDPRFPEHLQLFVVRVPRDNAYIAELEAEVVTFMDEVLTVVEYLKNMGAV